VRGGYFGEHPGVRTTSHLNVANRRRHAKQLFERPNHSPNTGAAGEHKGTVDVEKNQGGSVQRSAFAANVTGARSLGRWFFIKADTLTFVELVEAALDRAAVKEPFLPAIVADEPEPSVANESFDSAARHPSLLGLVQMPSSGISSSVPQRLRDFRSVYG
jgi:hypothetical protein